MIAAVIMSRGTLEDSQDGFVFSFERQRDLLDRYRQWRGWIDRTLATSERICWSPDGILDTATVTLQSGDDGAIVPIDVVGVAPRAVRLIDSS